MGDDTRDQLVAAAAEVFAEKGYERAGVAEIARRAGLTTGAIYSNFSGKAELLLEAIDLRAEDEFERLFNEHRFQGRATDILQTVGAHLVEPGSTTDRPHLLLEAVITARRDPELASKLAARIEARAGPSSTGPSTRTSTPSRWSASATPSASACSASRPCPSTCPTPSPGAA
jgi:TetR/AcrR family transcriptional regulator, repressor for uid operon